MIFALKSSIHAYLILACAVGDKVVMKAGFYYTANEGGRLACTVLSGWAYPVREMGLLATRALLLAAAALSIQLRG
ncbi:MAG: hypothetical protein AB1344_06810 [Pseudomonadota bacterium]